MIEYAIYIAYQLSFQWCSVFLLVPVTIIDHYKNEL